MSQELVKEYEALRKRSEQLLKEISKLEGSIETLQRTLKQEYKCDSLRQAQKEVKALRKRAAQQEAEFARGLARFKEEWAHVITD
jgi:uncharacterized coiled-coil DUF342 family protein